VTDLTISRAWLRGSPQRLIDSLASRASRPEIATTYGHHQRCRDDVGLEDSRESVFSSSAVNTPEALGRQQLPDAFLSEWHDLCSIKGWQKVGRTKLCAVPAVCFGRLGLACRNGAELGPAYGTVAHFDRSES
jgi:hypothetical protein